MEEKRINIDNMYEGHSSSQDNPDSEYTDESPKSFTVLSVACEELDEVEKLKTMKLILKTKLMNQPQC